LQHDFSIAAAADLLKVFGGTVPTLTTENQAHPSHPTTHRNHERATINHTNSGLTNSEGGCTMSKGGNYSTTKGGYYIKQHHDTQCHQTNAIGLSAPYAQ
jgi:hypothetical protein